MSQTITYRPATPDDALCLGVLAGQVFLDTYATQGIRPDLAREVQTCYSTDAMTALLADSAQPFMLAERDGHLIGFVQLALGRSCPVPSNASAEIVRLYVLRNVQRRGIGQALCAQAAQIAADAGHRAMWLTAWSGNAQALAFYSAQGWVDIGRTTYAMEGQHHANHVLARTLR